MACTWRIRHKLMLGMGLVVMIMALLLGGTLHGLVSYRDVMGTCESKLAELKEASLLKERIDGLHKELPDESLQARILLERLPTVKKALEDYHDKLKDTLLRRRALHKGERELAHVNLLKRDIQELEKAIRASTEGVRLSSGDLLDPRSEVSKKIHQMSTNASSLIDLVNGELGEPIEKTRKEARKSIMLLISTSVLAVLMMAGLLRFFYRWVAEPIHDLELGVSRVARGDFQHRIEINSGDEIEDLAKSYNEMTDKLRAMYDNLAQQVNERSRQLVRSERLAGVGFLAAGVAHEINNPLASIALCGEALESRLAQVLQHASLTPLEKETIVKYLKMIQDEAFRCKEITEKLLTFSRGGERKREQTNLADVIQGVLDVVQHLQNCKGKRIDFRANVPILAWTNAQEVKQVFLNLVVNALESMDDTGKLTIAHTIHDGMVELSFTDTGCGMTPDVLENVFEPFFTRSRTGKGTGLGLSICHRIITQHGGDIEAISDGPNRGSTFRVRLPLEAPANATETGEDVLDPQEEFLKLSMAKRVSKAA